ncbi:TRAP transporter small permease subunit [uncultured Thiothrix sp.]|uniref:TRAP transporter small permease subunit n=1 Tax=uncultured Thiothrix sp. TaxID=223185 RepID=UPI00260D865F|nr:TRAP transporter small permease subunit [uncultured Thiothrix sp.]
MSVLMQFSRAIDTMNGLFGRIANVLILLACLVSATNALLRYGFDLSDNWPLELQWYLFGGAVMLGAAYTLRENGHVRVDLLYGNVSDRTRLYIDIFGFIFFLLPACILFAWLSWTTLFLPSWHVMEQSSNSGGLPRYPVKFIVPFGFLLLTLQGISELIKRVAMLRGQLELKTDYEKVAQ